MAVGETRTVCVKWTQASKVLDRGLRHRALTARVAFRREERRRVVAVLDRTSIDFGVAGAALGVRGGACRVVSRGGDAGRVLGGVSVERVGRVL